MINLQTDFGISPALGVILLIGITVALSTIIGVVFLDIGDGLTQTVQGNVDVQESPEGVEITWTESGNAEEIIVQTENGSYQLNNVNDTITLGLREDSNISIIGKTTESETVIQEHTTEYTTGDNTVQNYSPGSTTIISGTVSVNPEIGDATVRVVKNDTIISKTTTDSTGDYSINAVEDSRLEVIVTNFDHSELEHSFYGSKIVQLTSIQNSNIVVDFDKTNMQEVQVNGNTVSVINSSYNGAKTIGSIEQLQAINNDLTSDYMLVNDINASETSSWNSGGGFEPIGSASTPFSGSIDGNGYSITDLYINRPSTDNVGFISSLASESSIKNTTVSVDITGNNYTGGISGESDNSTIKNVSISGSISGSGWVGGIVGSANNSGRIVNSDAEISVTGESYVGGIVGNTTIPIEESTVSGTVTSTGTSNFAGGLVGYTNETVLDSTSNVTVAASETNNVGGLVGYSEDEIANSSTTGNVTGDSTTGNLVGYLRGSITKSYATGNTVGSDNVGGLVGYNRGSITNSYATGDVQGEAYIGGFIGINKSATVQNAYSTGEVSETAPDAEFINGFIGLNSENISSSYWDTVSSSQSESSGSATGLTTTQMQGESATENLNGFDFTSIWKTEPNSYPSLRE